MDRDSEERLKQARRSDPPAIEALLERHLPGVVAYVRAHAGKKILAREASVDIVQSVCREVLQDLARYDYRDEAHFRHWLYLSAERKILERARFHGREKRGGAREAVPLSAVESELLQRSYAGLCSPSRAAIAREEVERAERALQSLSDEHRDVILLARVIGLSHAEIGRELGKSERAVTSLLHRALTELALAMGADESAG
jgi:RNA polymerase sigma-70 factor (ECF subfamily)